MDTPIRNPHFAASLALTYAELFDGVSPIKQRVSLRVNDGMLELKNVETHAEAYWPLDEIRQVPDQSDNAAMVFAPDDDHPARLVIREAEALRALAESDAPLEVLRGPRGGLRRLGLMAGLAAACFGGLLFGLVPWFANAAAERIPPHAEITMGQELFQQIYVNSGSTQCMSPAGLAALETMQTRLMGDTDLYIPVEVRVVRNPVVNATALSGGQVTLHSALITAAETPEEVAAVLAHEIGHVAHRDVTRAQLRAMGSYGLVGLLFGDVFGVSAAAGVSRVVLDASYSREAEAAADDFAHDMMRDAGLPPEALGTFFARLSESHGDMDMGVLSHISSHPEMQDRIEAAQAAGGVPQAGRPVLTDEEWQALRSICDAGPASPTGGAGGQAAGGGKG